MKKVVLSAFAFVMFSVVSANAQTAPQTKNSPAAGSTQTQAKDSTQTNTTAATTENIKTAITVEELPEAVKATLASPSLKVWTPYEAYLVKTPDGKEHYAINIKKDEQTGSVRLDKEGKPIK